MDVKPSPGPYHLPQTRYPEREKKLARRIQIGPLAHNLDRRNAIGQAQNKLDMRKENSPD